MIGKCLNPKCIKLAEGGCLHYTPRSEDNLCDYCRDHRSAHELRNEKGTAEAPIDLASNEIRTYKPGTIGAVRLEAINAIKGKQGIVQHAALFAGKSSSSAVLSEPIVKKSGKKYEKKEKSVKTEVNILFSDRNKACPKQAWEWAKAAEEKCMENNVPITDIATPAQLELKIKFNEAMALQFTKTRDYFIYVPKGIRLTATGFSKTRHPSLEVLKGFSSLPAIIVTPNCLQSELETFGRTGGDDEFEELVVKRSGSEDTFDYGFQDDAYVSDPVVLDLTDAKEGELDTIYDLATGQTSSTLASTTSNSAMVGIGQNAMAVSGQKADTSEEQISGQKADTSEEQISGQKADTSEQITHKRITRNAAANKDKK